LPVYASVSLFYLSGRAGRWPSAPGYKSAAGSRVAAKLQKELPPVALLQQRPHRLPSLRAFRLSASRMGWAKGKSIKITAKTQGRRDYSVP